VDPSSKSGDTLVEEITLVIGEPSSSYTLDTLPNMREETAVIIEQLAATTFNDLLAGEEVTAAFTLKIEDCSDMLGATVERTHEKGEYPRRLNWRERSSGNSSGSGASTWDP